jgi:hypothetical protein
MAVITCPNGKTMITLKKHLRAPDERPALALIPEVIFRAEVWYFFAVLRGLGFRWAEANAKGLAVKLRVLILGILLAICVGMADLFTGYETNFSVFYLIPLIVLTWYSDGKVGLALALVNAGVSLGADLIGEPHSLHSWYPYWNCVERLIVSILAVGLLARIRELHRSQEVLIGELNQALGQIKTLRGMIPICAWCKKVRGDGGFWKQVEVYIREHSDADFTHSICPECEQGMRTHMHAEAEMR